MLAMPKRLRARSAVALRLRAGRRSSGTWAALLLATLGCSSASDDGPSREGALAGGAAGSGAAGMSAFVPGTAGITAGVTGSLAGAGAGAAGMPTAGALTSPPPAGSAGMGDDCSASSPDSDNDGTPDCMDGCPSDPDKTEPLACGCGVAEDGCTEPVMPDGGPMLGPDTCAVHPIPDGLRTSYDLDSFYTRYADANGVPIVASDSPVDEAVHRACLIILDMSSAREDVRQELLDGKIRFIMMGADERTVDTPEFAYLGDLDWRARGLGSIPAAICAEENVLCDTATDRWRGESICVHEYAHTMHMGGYARAIPDFNSRLEALYDDAIGRGLWANTYAGEKPAEYLAEGIQDWYNTNLASRSGQADGVHNHVNTRQELLEYDPGLYELLEEVLPAEPAYRDCYYYE